VKSKLEQPQALRVKSTSPRQQPPRIDRPPNASGSVGKMTERSGRPDDKTGVLDEVERLLDQLDGLWARYLNFLDQYQNAQSDVKKLLAAVRLP